MRLMLKNLVATGLIVGLASACYAKEPTAQEIESQFNKILRNTKISSVRQSPVKGVYEIIAGPNVFYFSPEGAGHLIFGQIVDKNGSNLTAEIQSKLKAEYQANLEKANAEKLKNLPLDKAIKIGSGPNTIIEFTDPDCPYCRKVDEFLSKRNDVTRYVFLNPLDDLHPNSRAKSVFILNSKDTDIAFREVFSGKYDRGGLPISDDLSMYQAEAQRLDDGMKLGKDLGVRGTPMLFVNGSMVNGADFEKITKLLKK